MIQPTISTIVAVNKKRDMGVPEPPHTHLGLDQNYYREIAAENFYFLGLRSHQPRLIMLGIIRKTQILPFC